LAIAVSVKPGTISLGPSAPQQFAATVTGTTNTAVIWSISPQIGTISLSGRYTAPASITAQQTIVVTAKSAADPTKSGKASVTLMAPAAVAVSVKPGAIALGPSAPQQFAATVTGTANTAVTWSISPQIGTRSDERRVRA